MLDNQVYNKSQQKIISLFYRLIENESGDAATLAEALQRHVIKNKLPVKNFIGIGIDGANGWVK